MKKKLLTISLTILFLAVTLSGTYAYFTESAVATNVISSGSIAIDLQEWADEGRTQAFEDLEGMMPGTTATKLVEVKNTGTAPAWVRIKLDKAVTPAPGRTAELSTEPITLDLNTTEWQLGADGCYYYQTPLEPDAVTEPLFTSVSFAAGMGNEYQNSTATVTVTVQAVQTANNGAIAAEAAGWPDV